MIIEFINWITSKTPNEPPEIKGDSGGGDISQVDHFGPAGLDSQPLKGDLVNLVNGPQTGLGVVSGYHDIKGNLEAEPGESRLYARDSSGGVVCDIWLKADGDIVINSINSGKDVIINGVKIDSSGNISAPGEVSANSETVPINLTTHTHATAMGPTGPSLPG